MKYLEIIKKYHKDIILVIGVILISLFSFATGYITASLKDKEPLIIENIVEDKFLEEASDL